MLKSYEAIYDHGRIRWLDTPPDVEEARVIVTLLPRAGPGADRLEAGTTPSGGACAPLAADELLAATAGAWGKHTLAEVQALIEARRQADWGEA